MRNAFLLAFSLAIAACTASRPFPVETIPQATANATQCAPAGTAAVCTTMYFGLSQPKGIVSEQEWQTFLSDQVTARFPQGLTVWEADGQWRRPDGTIDRERAKMLLLIPEKMQVIFVNAREQRLFD